MKFDVNDIQHFGLKLVKINCFYSLKSEETLLSAEPISWIQCYRILVSYGTDIEMCEPNFEGSNPSCFVYKQEHVQP